MLKRPLASSISLLVVASTVAFGCSTKSSNSTADGAACTSGTDCKSRSCIDDVCAGSACDPDSTSTTQCESGWGCYSDKDTSLFGTTYTDTCVPLCGACPQDQHCPLVGGESLVAANPSSGIICAEGAPLAGNIIGPQNIEVGTNATFTATFASGRTFEDYNWFFAYTGEAPTGLFGSAGTQNNVLITQFSLPIDGDGTAQIWAQALDVNQDRDGAEIVKTIHITASP